MLNEISIIKYSVLYNLTEWLISYHTIFKAIQNIEKYNIIKII